MTFDQKKWWRQSKNVGQILFSYTSATASVLNLLSESFKILRPMKSSVTPVFRTQQCFFYFISNRSTKSKVRSLK